MVSESAEIYKKLAPRWWKVIRWREHARRFVKHQGLCTLYLKRPKTEEERMELKRHYTENPYIKNYEIDQYTYQAPPMYDVWLRRRNYPEHYGDKYNGFKRDGY